MAAALQLRFLYAHDLALPLTNLTTLRWHAESARECLASTLEGDLPALLDGI